MKPSERPQAKGTSMPVAEIASEAGRPFVSVSRQFPCREQQQQEHVEISDRVEHCFLRRIMRKGGRCVCGQRSPKTEGPRRVAAMS